MTSVGIITTVRSATNQGSCAPPPLPSLLTSSLPPTPLPHVPPLLLGCPLPHLPASGGRLRALPWQKWAVVTLRRSQGSPGVQPLLCLQLLYDLEANPFPFLNLRSPTCAATGKLSLLRARVSAKGRRRAPAPRKLMVPKPCFASLLSCCHRRPQPGGGDRLLGDRRAPQRSHCPTQGCHLQRPSFPALTHWDRNPGSATCQLCDPKQVNAPL